MARARKNTHGLPLMLNLEEVAALYRRPKSWIYEQSRKKALPGIVKTGRTLLFRRDDVLDELGL